MNEFDILIFRTSFFYCIPYMNELFFGYDFFNVKPFVSFESTAKPSKAVLL